MLSFSRMQSHGFIPPLELEVSPSASYVRRKGGCVDPSRQGPNTALSHKRWLYLDDNPPRLVTFSRVYEGSITVHNVPLGNDQVKVGVEEVQDVYVRVLVSPKKGLVSGADL